MPNDTEVTPQASEGLAPQEGASQESSSSSQGQQESQNDASTQVERGDSQHPSGLEPRPFERIAGRKFDKIEKAIRNLTELMQQSRIPAQPSSNYQQRQRYTPTQEDWKNPEQVIQRMLDDRLQEFPEKISQTLEQRERQLSFARSQRDAVKMIETNEAVKRDPEGIDRMKEILEDDTFGLNKMAEHYPVEAARAALEIYQSRYSSRRAAAAPTKSQMTSTATAINSGSGKTGTDARITEMYKKISAVPELMNDPKFQAELADLVKQSKLEDRLKAAS